MGLDVRGGLGTSSANIYVYGSVDLDLTMQSDEIARVEISVTYLNGESGNEIHEIIDQRGDTVFINRRYIDADGQIRIDRYEIDADRVQEYFIFQLERDESGSINPDHLNFIEKNRAPIGQIDPNLVLFSVEEDGQTVTYVVEGGSITDDGTILTADGAVAAWKDESGNYGQTYDSSRGADDQPAYSEALLNNYGVVVNGQAQTTFSGTARALADVLGFDGSFGIDGSFRSEGEGNEQGGNGVRSSSDSNYDSAEDRDQYHEAGTVTGTTALFPNENPDLTEFSGQLYPVIIDLDGDGIEVLTQGSAYFDLDGDGYREETSWVGPDDGFLIIDLNNNGEGRSSR